jgi:hypothetical protein
MVPSPHDHEHYALLGNAFNPDTGQLADYQELSQCSDGQLWQQSNIEEIARLAQGHGKTQGTNTIFFIPVHQIPPNRRATYLRTVCAYRPEKDNPRRVRWTCGGDKIDYPGDVSTKTAELTTVKILLNSVLSTPTAKFMTGDLKDFYLGTPMDRYEYMRVPLSMIPQEIIDSYQLSSLVHKGFIYVEIRKGMYGLPQAGRIANERLTKYLAPFGFSPVPITPGLWRHNTRELTFTLVVDDFGVKYTNQADAEFLIQTLEGQYTVKTDWTGSLYCGLTLQWDYKARTCDVSMPGYVDRALKRFQHPEPSRPHYAPHPYTQPNYGAKTQYAPAPDTSPKLDAANTKHIQEVLGTLLYYARAVDSTMLVAIGTLATEQAKGTETTLRHLVHLLNYCATNPEACIRYHASDMVLHIECDASYLSESKARSRAAGYHYLSSHPHDPTRPPTATESAPPSNGAIHVHCQILREVVSSAAEAELAALFHNSKEACPIRTTLEELGHNQPPTPIQTDNSTAAGIANDSVKQKRSKAMDMRFYWIRDRVRQGQFHVYWKPGKQNKADYFTKHHPVAHHRAIRSTYLYAATNPNKNYFECLADDDPPSVVSPT